MRLHLLSFFLLLISLSVLSQDKYNFSGLQGLKSDAGAVFFEFRGYDIVVSSMLGDVSSDTLINKFQTGNVIADYVEHDTGYPCRIIESEIVFDGEIGGVLNQVIFILEKQNYSVTTFQFQTYNQRDILLEKAFIKAFSENRLDEYISEDWLASKINILSQNIVLSNNCRWIKPHAVECGGSQILWSEFISLEDAILDIDNRIRMYDVVSLEYISETDIDVFFLGIPTVARKVVFRKANDDTNQLQVYYYLVQEIDDRSVSCVLSNPVESEEDGLAPLLQQVMVIPVYTNREYGVDEGYDEDSSSFRAEVQASSFIPLGRLGNAYGYAPSLSALIGFPVNTKKQLFIDLALQLALPLGKKRFDFNDKGEVYETQADFLMNGSLRLRKFKDLSSRLRFSTYVGLGFSFIQTDLESWNDGGDSSKYEAIGTVDVLGGVSFHYRRVGAFIEYHYSPYSISNKVNNYFGHSVLHLGLSYSFELN